MKPVVIVIALASSSSATSCLDSRQGRVGDAGDTSTSDTRPAPADGSSGADTATLPDAPSDTSVAPDACVPTFTVDDRGSVLFQRWDDGMHVTLDDGVVYGGRRREEPGRYFDVEIVAYDLDTRTERVLTDNDVDDAVVDARGGAVLVWRREGNVQSLARLGPGAWSYTVPEGFMFVPGFVDDGAPRRMIDGPRAAWAESWVGGGPQTKGRIVVREGGQARVVADVAGFVRAPYVRGRSIVWSEQRPMSVESVLRRAQGDEVSEIARGAIGAYATLAGAPEAPVVWLRSEGLAAGRGAAVLALGEGTCGSLAVGEDVVAAVCTRDGAQPDIGGFIARGDVAVHRLAGDGLESWTLPIDDEVVVAGLRVDGQRAAWVEYAPGVGCGGTIDDDRGALVVTDYRSGARVTVSEVGAGCWCCGAYWPPIGVALEGDRVAWSYALDAGGEQWATPAAIGFARVSGGCQ